MLRNKRLSFAKSFSKNAVFKPMTHLPSNSFLNRFDSNAKFSWKERLTAIADRRPLVALPEQKLRIFTKNINLIGSLLRLSLKPWAAGFAHSSYKMPFHFDRKRFLSYRVEAKPMSFSFDREQRKYFLNYVIGGKTSVNLSSRLFLNFKASSTYGNLPFFLETSIHFFKTLSLPSDGISSLYNFPKIYKNSNFFKTKPIFSSYNWHLEFLFKAFKKRFVYNRKLQKQNEDIDLFVSSTSLDKRLCHWPSSIAFLAFTPARYSSFLISSDNEIKRLGFAFRFFRYFHKIYLRKNFWSFFLQRFWKSLFFQAKLQCDFFYSFDDYLKVYFDSKLILFNKFKFFILTWFFSFFSFKSLNIHLRIFYSFLLLFISSLLVNSFWFIWFNSNLLSPHCLFVDFAWDSIYSVFKLLPFRQNTNKLFLTKPWSKKYLIVKLDRELHFFCKPKFYYPWHKRFMFSLKNFKFLAVFPKALASKKPNLIARKRSRKNIFKKDWFLFDFFNITQERAISFIGRFLLMFLHKQTSFKSFSIKLPIFLKTFFKFSKRLFGDGNLYTSTLFSYSYANNFLSQANSAQNFKWNAFFSFFKKISVRLAKELLFNSKKKKRRKLFFLYRLACKQMAYLFLALRRFKDTFRKAIRWKQPLRYKALRKYPVPQPLSGRGTGYFLKKLILNKSRFNNNPRFLNYILKLCYWQFPSSLRKNVLLSIIFGKGPKLRRPWYPFVVFTARKLFFRILRVKRSLFRPWWRGLRRELKFNKLFTKQFSKIFKHNTLVFNWFKWWATLFQSVNVNKVIGSKKNFFWYFNYFSFFLTPHYDYRGWLNGRFYLLAKSQFFSNNLALKESSSKFSGYLHSFKKLALNKRLKRKIHKFKKEQKLAKFYIISKKKPKLRSSQFNQIRYLLPKTKAKSRSRNRYKIKNQGKWKKKFFNPKPRFTIDFKRLKGSGKVTRNELISILAGKGKGKKKRFH